MEAPNAQKEIIPDKTVIYQPEEKWYTLEQNTYDIGEYLNLLNIKPYNTINIKLKEGNLYGIKIIQCRLVLLLD